MEIIKTTHLNHFGLFCRANDTAFSFAGQEGLLTTFLSFFFFDQLFKHATFNKNRKRMASLIEENFLRWIHQSTRLLGRVNKLLLCWNQRRN